MTVLDLPDTPGAARDTIVLKHVANGDADVSWGRLLVAGRVELLVMLDALKLGGVRIGAGAQLAQQVADLLGGLLLTPKVLDLMYLARAVTVEPMTQYDATQMLTTHWFEKESARIDAAIASAGGVETGGIVQTVGKPWMLTNGLLSNVGKSCNYGWHTPPGSVQVKSGSTIGSWKQTPAYQSVTLPGIYVLQQPGYAHGLDEADYSEMIVLMHRDCTVDGQPADLANVLTDPKLASLISHEGPLKVPGLRQPGIPVYSCAFQPKAKVMAMTDSVTSGMCPLPPPPKNIVSQGRSPWPWVATGLTVAGAGALYARHRGWLPLRRS